MSHILNPDACIRQAKVLEIVPFSPATLWRKVKEGTFPDPLKLSPRVTVWRVRDVQQWVQAQAGVKPPPCVKRRSAGTP